MMKAKTYPAIRWTVTGAIGEVRGIWLDCEDAWLACFILARREGIDADPEIRADGWAASGHGLYIRTFNT